MNPKTKLVIRIITGGVLAFVMARIFRPEAGPGFMIGLFIALVGAAYGLEFLHNRKKQS